MRSALLTMLGIFVAGGCQGEDAPPVTTEDVKTQTVIIQKAAAGDWPRWRGPHGDGISREVDWSHDWGKDGPKQLWKTNVGVGFSTVSVADGRLYTMGHNGKKGGDGRDTVFCLDATTGEEIWKHAYACKLVDNLYEGGPNATPTIEGSHLYTLGKQGQLKCFDAAKGELRWEVALSKVLETKMPAWGYSSSPLVLEDRVIVDGGRTAAFNKQTGELVWKTDSYHAGYGSVVAFADPDSDATRLTVANNEYLLVLDAKDGSLIDRSKWGAQFRTASTTPIVVGRTIFISGGYGKGCELHRLTEGRLEKIYKSNKMSNHFSNCVVIGGYLFGIHGNTHVASQGRIVCMDHATGEQKWYKKGFGTGSITAAGDRLIVLSDKGELVIASASVGKFMELARAKVLAGKCWTVPVLSHRRIYCRNAKGDLVCVALEKRG